MYQGYELVRRYRQAGVDRAFELLTEYVSPGDWVPLGFEGAYALRPQMEMPPRPRPNEEDLIRRDLSVIAPRDRDPWRQRHQGVQYCHSGGFYVDFAGVWKNVVAVGKYCHLKTPRQVWLMQGAWSQPFMERFGMDRETAPIGQRAYQQSNGMLLGINTRVLYTLATDEQ